MPAQPADTVEVVGAVLAAKACSCIKGAAGAPESMVSAAVATSVRPQRESGITGRTVFLKVAFVTPANEAYQAAAAVATPSHPPA